MLALGDTIDGPAVYTTDPAWSETDITWNRRPSRTSAAVDDKGPLSADSWVEFDVTPIVSANDLQLRPRGDLERRGQLLLSSGEPPARARSHAVVGGTEYPARVPSAGLHGPHVAADDDHEHDREMPAAIMFMEEPLGNERASLAKVRGDSTSCSAA